VVASPQLPIVFVDQVPVPGITSINDDRRERVRPPSTSSISVTAASAS
jgi:hypothetical protein